MEDSFIQHIHTQWPLSVTPWAGLDVLPALLKGCAYLRARKLEGSLSYLSSLCEAGTLMLSVCRQTAWQGLSHTVTSVE